MTTHIQTAHGSFTLHDEADLSKVLKGADAFVRVVQVDDHRPTWIRLDAVMKIVSDEDLPDQRDP